MVRFGGGSHVVSSLAWIAGSISLVWIRPLRDPEIMLWVFEISPLSARSAKSKRGSADAQGHLRRRRSPSRRRPPRCFSAWKSDPEMSRAAIMGLNWAFGRLQFQPPSLREKHEQVVNGICSYGRMGPVATVSLRPGMTEGSRNSFWIDLASARRPGTCCVCAT